MDEVYKINPKFMRPAEVPYLCGDPSKAKKVLGWRPQHNWKSLLELMYKSDYRTAAREVYTYR